MLETFAVIGFIATAFVLCLLLSRGMIEGTTRRLNAHRIGLDAYYEARSRALQVDGEMEAVGER